MAPFSRALLSIAMAMAALPRTASAVSWVLGHEGESCAEACAQGCSEGEALRASTPEAFGAIAEQLNVRCELVVQKHGDSCGPSVGGGTCRLYAGGVQRAPEAQAFCDLKPPPSEARFCPCRGRPFPEEYDCEAGLLRWRQGWSAGKKKWCCANHGKGCAQARAGAPVRPRSDAKLRGPVPIFDCVVTQTNRLGAWSPDQQEWCCAREFVGCKPGQAPDSATLARKRLLEQAVYWVCSAALIAVFVICYSIWGGEDTARPVPYGQSVRSLTRASRATSDLAEEFRRDREAQDAKEAAVATAVAEAAEAEERREQEEAERRRRKEQEAAAAAEEGAARASYSAGTLLRGSRKPEDAGEGEKAKRKVPCGNCACSTSAALVSEPQPRRQ